MKRFILIFFLVFHPTAESVEFPGSLSVEQNLRGTSGALSHTLRFLQQAKFQPVLFPFFHAGSLGYSSLRAPISFEPGSYAYLGPGIGFQKGPLWASVEFRVRKHLATDESELDVDLVGNVLYEDYWDSNPLWDGGLYPFVEPYLDLMFTLADEQNLVLTGLVKFGLGLKVWENAFWDVHLEPYITLDRKGYYFNNLAEPKLATRFQLVLPALTASLSFSYIWSRYLQWGDYDPEYAINPGGFRTSLNLVSQW